MFFFILYVVAFSAAILGCLGLAYGKEFWPGAILLAASPMIVYLATMIQHPS